MNRTLLFIVLISLVFLQFINGQEKENRHPILKSKFQIGVGVYFPTQNVKFSVEGNSDNQIIDFDKTFDFNNNQVTPQVFFDWRFSKKWKLSAEYFNVNYMSKTVLEEDVNAGDYTLKSGSNVEVGYKLNLYRVFVGTLIVSSLKHELGGGIGLHVLNVGPFIQGNIIVNETDNEFKRINTSATAPLPNISLWYHYAPTQKWMLGANVDWFGMNLNEYSGFLWDVSPSVSYQIINNLAVSLDYRFFMIRANIKEDYWNGGVDLSFSGATLKLIGNF